jgi:sterol desaturase/sphingolipid hydroxylase (fatty acid hydroxylase superfamily)
MCPIERLWPQYPEQGTFRDQWTLDIVYFMSTHLPIQILSLLVLLPATEATKYLAVPSLQNFIAHLPLVLQFFLAVVVADLAEWTVHLALHKVPFLWRFHSIHHSSKALDWIAGSRSHFLTTRWCAASSLVPMMLGFSQGIIVAYLIFVTLQATWTHCNFGPQPRWLEKFLVLPAITTGTTHRSRRPSTRTLRFTSRGSTSCLAPTTSPTTGQKDTVWRMNRLRWLLAPDRSLPFFRGNKRTLEV